MSAEVLTQPDESERLRRQRAKNWAIGGILLAVVVLIYVTFMVRMGGV
jgi:hypothetical protein